MFGFCAKLKDSFVFEKLVFNRNIIHFWSQPACKAWMMTTKKPILSAPKYKHKKIRLVLQRDGFCILTLRN